MTRYFRKVADPQRLLARERAPVTGRRVPKVRSKQSQATQASTAATAGVPVAAVVAGAVVAVLAVAGVVTAIAASGGDDAAAQTSTPVAASASTAFSPSAITSPVTTVTADAATSIVQPSTTAATSTTLVVEPIVRLVSAAAATAATIIPTDPASSATYSGPMPAFNFAIDCTSNSCSFSMRAFAPGTVTDEGLTTVPATAGRFVITSTSAATCTTSNGNQLSRDVSSVIDLTLSGSQVVNGVSVPQQITGTLSTVTPDAGYVPKVGDVVDQGADVGCAGQTLIFDVAGTLAPG